MGAIVARLPRMTRSQPLAETPPQTARDLEKMLGVGDLDLGVFTDEELALFDSQSHLRLHPEDGRVLAASARSLVARGYAAPADDSKLVFGGELSLVLQARASSASVASVVHRTEVATQMRLVYLLDAEVALEEVIEMPGIHVFRLRKPARALSDLARFLRGGATGESGGETRTIPFDRGAPEEPLEALFADAVAVASMEVWRRTDDDQLLSTGGMAIEDRSGALWFVQSDREAGAINAQTLGVAQVEEILTTLVRGPAPG